MDVDRWDIKAGVQENTYYFLRHRIQKMAVAKTFLRKVEEFQNKFEVASSILELGGGSCWAAYIVKTLFPGSYVCGTDIAPGAVENSRMWESVFQTEIDNACTCPSYETPFSDESFDLVFCFEAAHHFWKHKQTLVEINRILKPGGRAIYMHEPGCRSYIYKLAHSRVSKKRVDVLEDVLVYKNIVSIGEKLGMSVHVLFDPDLDIRGPKETLYYYLLNKVPILQNLLPCTIDIVFEKPQQQQVREI